MYLCVHVFLHGGRKIVFTVVNICTVWIDRLFKIFTEKKFSLSMAARAAATFAARRNLQFFGHRFRASNCRFFSNRVTATEGVKLLGNTTRIYGTPPKFPGQDRPKLPSYDPPSITSVSEAKFMFSAYRLIDGLKNMFLHRLIDDGLHHPTVDISPNPKLDIFIIYDDEDGCQYFTVHSAEDGNISPAKYYIYSPFRDFSFTENSCNGLLLFQNAEWENLVWNPTTNQFNIFPKTFEKPPPGVMHSYLATGMWCDPSYGYKVLQVVEVESEEYFDVEESYHIELYSYKTNSWKIIQCGKFAKFGYSGSCINGAFHSTGRREGGDTFLVSFDFSTETLSTTPLPNQSRGSDDYCFLEYKGLLGCLFYWRNYTKCRYELWVMTNDKSWTRETVFNTCGVQKPLWFSQNGELLYFATFDHELVVFDRATGKLKNLDICFYAGYVMELIPVPENLVPLDRLLDVEVQDKKAEEKAEDVTEANDGPLVQA